MVAVHEGNRNSPQATEQAPTETTDGIRGGITVKREDITHIAREAGFVVDEKALQHQPNCIFHTHHMVDELLERFAALVAAAEREACAAICDRFQARDVGMQPAECAGAIRARGDK